MSVILANILSFVLLAILVFYRYRRNHSWIEPGIIFAINLMLLYPIRGVVIFLFGDDAQPDFYGAQFIDNLKLASWLAVLGSLGYITGYMAIMRGRKLQILHGGRVSESSYALRVCLIFFLASLVGIGYKIATGDYISFLIGQNRNSALTQISNLLTAMEWPAYIGAWILFFSGARSRAFLLLFGLINAVVIPYQFLQGSKTFLSLLMVGIVISYYWVNQKLPKFFVLISIYLVATFVFPYVLSFRDSISIRYGKIPSIQELSLYGIDSYKRNDKKSDANPVIKVLANISARYGGIDHLYGITVTVPSILEYRYLADYSAVFVNIVPRAIWPDKPIYSRGADYGSALGATTSITPFPYGEAYWSMGLPGLFIMMFVWGSLLAAVTRLYDSFSKRRRASFFILLYFLAQIYWISGGETSMPSVISGLPQEVAMLFCLYLTLQILSPRR